MNGLFAAAAVVQGFLEKRGWRFCFIGGLAVLRWGEPRQTRDIDLTLLTGFGEEERFIDPLLSRFPTRLDDARNFALDNRVLLLATDDGVGIDIALGALPFEERAVARATDWALPDDLVLRTCSAEDLIVYKAFAGRPQDWVDVEMVAVRNAGHLHIGLVLDEVGPLLELKGAPEDLPRLRALLAHA